MHTQFFSWLQTRSGQKIIVIFLLIFFLGIFLRTYHFHNWLVIRDDQSRDASLISSIVQGNTKWPLMGPFMSYSGDGDHSEENAFHIGPMYYYFQIVSAKMFGDYPDKLAYPDVFFGILTIPLLFFFLRLYYTNSIALAVTSVFAISAYFVQYARFSWNTNLIPFFVLLFLVSLYTLLCKSEKERWIQAIVFGCALGIGIQLHVITMIIFLSVSLYFFLFLLRNRNLKWKEWILILFTVCILNTAQIINEWQTHLSNTKTLFYSASKKSSMQMDTFLHLLKNDIGCHMEAHTYFLSSYGGSRCSHNLFDISTYNSDTVSIIDRVVSLATILFSLLGYIFLLRYTQNEQDTNKRYFLHLVSVYAGIALLVMFSLSRDKLNDFRYFTPTFFIPFLFLGFFIRFIIRRVTHRFLRICLFIFVLIPLFFSNVKALAEQFISLQSKDRTCSSHFTTLGEIEPVVSYIVQHIGKSSLVYIRGDKDLHVIFPPMYHLLKKQGIDAMEMKRTLEVPNNVPAYLISCRKRYEENYPYEKINSFTIIQIHNEEK